VTRRRIVFALLAFGWATSAFGWETGNDLIPLWKEYKADHRDYYSSGMFIGYIAATLDGLDLTNYVLDETHYGDGDLGFEIPKDATLGQLCSVVGKWLENHPEKWNMSGTLVVIAALREAFPKGKRKEIE